MGKKWTFLKAASFALPLCIVMIPTLAAESLESRIAIVGLLGCASYIVIALCAAFYPRRDD